MNAIMLTPLFPPDTNESAQYAKLVATKLQNPSLSVIAYGRLPETVPGVDIVSIDKSGLKLATVYRCLTALTAAQPDTILLHNGPSTDFPALLYKIFHPAVRIVYIESDPQAVTYRTGWLTQWINTQIKNRAIHTVTLPEETAQYLPAEILPFSHTDTTQERQLSAWWEQHIATLHSYVS